MSLNISVPPGLTLAESLEASNMTQNDLAERTGLSRKTINGIVNNTERITPETALQFETVFRVPARFWNSLQTNYDEAIARRDARKRLASFAGWIDEQEIPVKELAKRGLIPTVSDASDRLIEVLSFFGVASPTEFDSIWKETAEVCAYRKSEKHASKFGAVAAWLRQGELAAMRMDCPAYDRDRLDAALNGVRALVPLSIGKSHQQIVRTLCASGVALVFVPGIPGAPIYGATRWLGSKAIVQMSLRGKDDSNFWFTLFHELGHVRLHGKKEIFLELDKAQTTDKEKEADAFARERLIPIKALHEFTGNYGDSDTPVPIRVSKAAIKAFAASVRVSPGVVVGRLQHDGWMPHKNCNDLKAKLDFAQ